MSQKICLHHICVRVSNLKQSEIFYRDFLGLNKLSEFSVAPEHAQMLFNVPLECHFISFECPEGGGLEIYSYADRMAEPPKGNHFCLGVYHRNELVEQLLQSNVTIREIAREDRRIIFILDPDGNLIELKDLKA